MAYTFDPIFAADPNNPVNVASNAAITIFDPNDPGKAPITITDPTDSPIPNPVTVNKNGFGPAFKHATLDRVGWSGGGFEGFLTSYEGIKNEAVAARTAAETAAADAATAATAGVADVANNAAAAETAATAAASDAAAAATAAANSASLVGAPADTAIATAMKGPATQTKAALERLRVAPVLSPLTERIEPLRTVVIQTTTALYAAYSRTGSAPRFEKSTDGGKTWVTKVAAMPGTPGVFALLKSGTLLAVENTGTITVGGSMPRLWRSTNDGATWTEVVGAGLKFPPLSAQGISEGTDGSVLIGEYGNVGNHQYRIMRSTDDGLTWAAALTTDGTEPAGDPGHIHSVTYDPFAAKHVAFCDRPITGSSGPRIYTSSDNGATWTLLGESITVDYPNFVTPMYFENYIAWGSDNEINGRVSRIKRTDFYAGQFNKAETVAQLDQKAMYFAFPIRPDVWAVTMAGEHIVSGSQTGGPGSTMNEVWLVSADGSLVTGGMESYYVLANPGALSTVRASVPARVFDQFDHAGLLWVNMPVGLPRPYAAVPATQGWSPSIKRVTPKAIPYLPKDVGFSILRSSNPTDEIRFLEYLTTYVSQKNTVTSGGGEIRYHDSGRIDFLWNGTILISIIDGQFRFNNGEVNITSTGVGLRTGSGSPEGVVTSPVGTLYLNYGGAKATSVWVKEVGNGNTGWQPVGHSGGTTASRPASPTVGLNHYDTTISKAIWWNGSAWVDANGVAV